MSSGFSGAFFACRRVPHDTMCCRPAPEHRPLFEAVADLVVSDGRPAAQLPCLRGACRLPAARQPALVLLKFELHVLNQFNRCEEGSWTETDASRAYLKTVAPDKPLFESFGGACQCRKLAEACHVKLWSTSCGWRPVAKSCMCLQRQLFSRHHSL